MSKWFYQFLILGGMILFGMACHSPKASLASIPSDSKNKLIDRVNLHIKCMNDRQFDQLENLYHPDFSSISPSLPTVTKTQLLESIQSNLSKNQTLIKGDILSSEISHSMAYVTLRWRIVNPIPDSDQWEITFDQNLMEIWKTNEKGIWQLSKVLFYRPEG